MGFLVIHYIQNLKKKLNIVWYTNTFNTKLFSKTNIQQPRKWLRNEQVHPMISNFIKNFFFSSRENAKTKRKRSRQVGEFMFNNKRACYIYGTKLWIKRPLSEATSIFLGANTDESVTLPTANLIKLFLGSLSLKCRISKSKSASSSNSDVSFFIVSSINWFPKRVFITKGLNQHQNAIRQFIYPASLKFASMMEYLINWNKYVKHDAFERKK